MEENKEVVVVSIDNYSFDILLKKKFYAFPKGSRKIGEYFAFYKGGAITHYGKVKSSKEVGKSEIGFGYWLYCFPDAEPPFQMVTFNKIMKLKFPIKKTSLGRGKGIQGRIYTTLNKLLNAKDISDLF